ncbi:MAG: hypothetical protein QOG27_1359 [Verrucomicrobiota bacterium]
MTRLVALIGAFLAATALAETFSLPCRFIAGAPKGPEKESNCAARRKGRIVVSRAAAQEMSCSADGLAAAFIDHGWYYVKKDGRTLSVVTSDNGADYVSEGLVRSRVAGKIAYFDTDFRQVVPPTYDWGWPFEGGKALVCRGCVESAPDNDGHTMREGGSWGYIDRKGHEIVSVTRSREEIRKWERPK